MLEFSQYLSNLPDLPYANFAEMIDITSNKYASRDAILYRCGKQREFTRWNYAKWGDECRKLACGLLSAGLVKGDCAVLWSENRPEWMAVWMGAIIAGLVIVPVDFLGTEQECLNIIKITKAKAFFYSGRKKDFAKDLPSNGISMAVSVCISSDSEDSPSGSFPNGNAETEYSRFVNKDHSVSMPPSGSISPNDPASIVFTSGTTGFAKGVTLSHKNIISNASAAIQMLEPGEGDVFMDVLPLHHTYPTTCSFIAPLSIGIPTVNTKKIVGKVVVDDIKDGGVTYLIGVPLLYDKVMAAIESGYQKLPVILRISLNVLRKIALKKAKNGNPEFGRKVFKFIRKKASLDSIYIMVAGGGPLSVKTADFFDSFGFNIVQGYGMSENAPLITVNTPRYKRNASVGLPVSYTDVKIIDPTPDGIGEIACKSPSVMLGYFENEEATKEVIDKDGYLLTGDLGYRDEDGFVYIVGRRKNLIVGSGGKNIYPEEVESHFSGSRVILEVLVVGRKEPSYGGETIFAVIVPNYELIKEDYPGREDDNSFIHGLVKKEVEGANRSLPVFKKISDFTLRKEPFEKNAQQKIRRFLYKSYENPVIK
jgi:long-chain acyl-CoA synthetase